MYEMKPMAESLASQGRYGDSMLVHMNPVEVAGLRAAAQRMGGDLTTNPQTGQPEAFLPFLLGLGLQGGLGLTALQAGLATGLGTAAITGDLGQGALAGLGAFGGAGMGEGLSAAGTAAQASQVTPGIGMDMANAASQASTMPGAVTPAQSLIQNTMPPIGPQSFAPTAGAPLMPTDVLSSGGDLGLSSMSAPGTSPIGFTQPIAPPSPFSSAVTEGTGMALQESLVPPGGPLTGLKSVFSGGDVGTAAREGFMEGIGGEKGLFKYGAAGIAPYAFEQPTLEGMERQRSLIRPFDYDPYTREFTERTPYTAPGPEYMADGGIVERNQYNYDPNTQLFSQVQTPAPQSQPSQFASMLAQTPFVRMFSSRNNQNVQDPPLSPEMSSMLTQSPLTKMFSSRNNQDAQDSPLPPEFASIFDKLPFGRNRKTSSLPRYSYSYDPQTQLFSETPRMAQGGLTGYKEGNILRGQGDGMSDEIEASIGGEQDVLLSDGEYVIPADAVAMLGNGSTDAGANRLDEMIARLRMKKYGRDKQPPEMKAESVMPT